MEDGGTIPPKTFFNHVFSTSEDGKAEIMNALQYSFLGLIPIVLLNKLVHRFIPDADPDKSSLEIIAEVIMQITAMFIGIILIHRTITYIPTYSDFKYDAFHFTNVILSFLVIVLSIQTKLGIKINILWDRLVDSWNGSEKQDSKNVKNVKNDFKNDFNDFNDKIAPQDIFPPRDDYRPKDDRPIDVGPMAANGVLGGSFGTSF